MNGPEIVAQAAIVAQPHNFAHSSRRRLLRGFIATAMAPVTASFIQIINVPVFLHSWGAEIYGEWLILIALPTYLLLSDLGFGSVAGNEMTMQVAGGKRECALATYQSTRLLVILLSAVIAGAAVLVLWLAPIAVWLHITHISPRDAHVIILLLVAQVLLHLQNNLTIGVFRCEGLYAFGTCCLNLASLAEALTVTAVVLAGGSPLHAALAYCLAKAATTIVLMILLRLRIDWIGLGFSKSSLKIARSLSGPAFAFMAFPLGTAINMQGIVIVIGLLCNPVSVVVFSTLRTLTRFGIQFVGLVSNTVWPELSLAFGHHELAHARWLHRRTCQLTLWLALVTVGGLTLSGPVIYPIWVSDRVPMDYVVFYLMLLIVIANSFWSASSVASVSCNAHRRIATVYLAGSLASIALSIILIPRLGLSAPALCLLVVDILMILVVVRHSVELLDDNVSELWRSALSIPPITSMARSFIQEARLLWS